MRLCGNRCFGVMAVGLLAGWMGVEGQNATGKTPMDYVDTLIGTINGGNCMFEMVGR
jgi:hypothetical protein